MASSWAELIGQIKSKVQEAMADDVKDEVKDVYAKNIQETVYDSYTPVEYERRGELGDELNLVGKMNGDTLEVRNVAVPSESIYKDKKGNSAPVRYSPPNDTQFASWIETGAPYTGKAVKLFPAHVKGQPWTVARPFTKNTIADLSANKQHVNALKSGLNRRGIPTK